MPRHHVAPGGGTDAFGTLQEAIGQAEPGSEIRLAAGRYELAEPLSVPHAITLVGVGMEETQIVCAAAGFVLRFDGTGAVSLRGITFAHEGEEMANIVIVSASRVDVRSCRFTGAIWDGTLGGNGLSFLGEMAGQVISCETIGGRYGILVGNSAEVTLQGNRCVRASRVGIAIAAGGSVVRRNQLEGCNIGIAVENASPVLESNIVSAAWAGIWYEAAGGGIARQNRVTGCVVGIGVTNDAAPTLEDNECLDNSHAGIGYVGTSSGTAARNRCTGNGNTGISVRDQAHPTLEGNECTGNSEAGITYTGESHGVARANHSSRNGGPGVSITGAARPDIEDHTCEANDGAGIRFGEASTGRAARNTCTGNERGISVRDSATPVLEGNVCTANTMNGIDFWDAASGAAVENTCHANGEGGIVAGDTAAPIVERNVSTGNADSGIELYGNSTAKVLRNTVRDNKANGISVSKQAQPILERNVCSGSTNGILFEGGAGTAVANTCEENDFGFVIRGTARPFVSNNFARNNQTAGILVGMDAAPDLVGNTCTRNLSGIVYAISASGTARGNTCSQNFEDGIMVVNDALPVLERNICTGNVREGIMVHPPAKPTLTDNVTSHNHAPDPRVWSLHGSLTGRTDTQKEWGAVVGRAIAPQALLERVARVLDPVWRVQPRMQSIRDLPGAWQMSATQHYRETVSGNVGTVVLAATAYPHDDRTVLRMHFTEERQPMWMAQVAEQMIAAAMFGVANDLIDVTGAREPWEALQGDWRHTLRFGTQDGIPYQIIRRR